jgi:hypothetical protein
MRRVRVGFVCVRAVGVGGRAGVGDVLERCDGC